MDLFDRIPIRFILNHVESYQHGNAYKSIYSDLLALSANLYPELFDIQSFLIQEGRDSTVDSLWQIKTVYRDWKKNLTTAELEQLLSQWETNVSTVVDGMSVMNAKGGGGRDIDAIQVLFHLETIATTVHVQDHASCMLSTLMPPCLDGKLDTRIAEALTSTWEAYNRIIPHTLWTMTINLLTSGYDQRMELLYSC